METAAEWWAAYVSDLTLAPEQFQPIRQAFYSGALAVIRAMYALNADDSQYTDEQAEQIIQNWNNQILRTLLAQSEDS